MDAWPRNFTPSVVERTKLKGGTKKGLNGGHNSRIFNKRNITNLNIQTWKVGRPW
jgi:hypothetical protein